MHLYIYIFIYLYIFIFFILINLHKVNFLIFIINKINVNITFKEVIIFQSQVIFLIENLTIII
jgi:hypothetical protein